MATIDIETGKKWPEAIDMYSPDLSPEDFRGLTVEQIETQILAIAPDETRAHELAQEIIGYLK